MRRDVKTGAKINSLNTEPESKEEYSPSIFKQRQALGQDLKVIHTQRKKSEKEQKEKSQRLEVDLEKIHREKIVKHILNTLGISSIKDLPTNVSYLEAEN